ncbi:unnamed protein product [Brugia timori]|uniref:Transposase n=1 Tax=Brugia timori TaxID=42155 RepID=A0A0R3R9J1_9BILA|nr:unnamed protein product [Brugia timori]
MEKYGKLFIVKKPLYNELNSTKRNDRDWKAIVKATEENILTAGSYRWKFKDSNNEISVENKLTAWIVDKLYQLKEKSTSKPVKDIGQYLTRLVLRNEVVVRS